MKTLSRKEKFESFKLLYNFYYTKKPLKNWINEKNLNPIHYNYDWNYVIPVIKKIDSYAHEQMTVKEYKIYKQFFRMIDNPSKYHISDVHTQAIEFIKYYNKYIKQTAA